MRCLLNRLNLGAGLVVGALVMLVACDDPSATTNDIDPATGGQIVYEDAKPQPSNFVDPGKNAPDPIAKRSAFPEPGENLVKPIAAVKLTQINQFALDIDPADIPAIVPWDKASQYVGYEITVEGKIVSVGQSRSGKINFLNFHKDWRGKFYMVIFDDLAKTLDKPVKELFEGKTLRVKGKVDLHNSRPQIKITSMDQVKVIEE